MKKFLIFTFILSLSLQAFARDCQVYGISDSPQKLSCTFKNLDLNLRCQNGDYYLNTTKVTSAFHLEVEEGPVPLVFKAPNLQLTVIIDTKVDILADLERAGHTISGTCL
jgi:hypothetical protein